MRLEFKDGKSNKFWQAQLGRTWLDVSWGRIGTRGQTKRQGFGTGALAKQAFEKLVAEKKKKGYRELGATPAPAPATARDEKLEASLRARRDDQAAYLVYSDFLQGCEVRREAGAGEVVWLGGLRCPALRELKVGVIRWDEHEEDLQTLFEVAGQHAWAASLERLHLGDLSNVDMAHHSIGRVGKPTSKAFPGCARWCCPPCRS